MPIQSYDEADHALRLQERAGLTEGLEIGPHRHIRRVSPCDIALIDNGSTIITYHRCGRLTIKTHRLTRTRAAILNIHTPTSMPVLFEGNSPSRGSIYTELPQASTWAYISDMIDAGTSHRIYLGSCAVRINLGETASA